MNKIEFPTSLKNKIDSLPNNPGIYKFLNSTGKIIYVGKAKNLKKRVNSYFVNPFQSNKTSVLVKNIKEIEYIVVDTEEEALLLENALIKQFLPRYNVLLKDDKTYPWICVKNEVFPRVYYTRKKINDKSTYFGPYSSVRMVKILMDFIRQIYPLRTCSLNLSQANINSGKYKKCLEFHIGNCKAPCEKLENEDDYNVYISCIKNILKGNIAQVRLKIKDSMLKAAEELKFEEANIIKEKLSLIDKYQSRSTVVNSGITNIDVFSFLDDINSAYVNFIKVVNGATVQSFTLEIKKRLNESKEDLLLIAITEIRQRIESDSKEILIPFELDYNFNNATFTVPIKGDKKKLLDFSLQNAKLYKLEQLKNLKITDPESHSKRILEVLKKDLNMKEIPNHIECFDNSNIQGKYPVSSCVVFKNAKPSKKDYRIFNIKDVEGPNDFATMEEVIYRRYFRLISEKQQLPQLIIIDGGKGQLNSAYKVLKNLEIDEKITIIGIAKKLEEIFFYNDPIPLFLDKNSESLKLIQSLRNEAHRFGITHHRNLRSKSFISSELEEIRGIGSKTAEYLLKIFHSVERVKTADKEALVKAIGKKKALIIKNYFLNKK